MPDGRVLTGGPRPVEVAAGGFTMLAPGLTGEVTEWVFEGTGRAGSVVERTPLDEAIGRCDIDLIKLLSIRVDSNRPLASGGSSRAVGADLRTSEGEPAVVLGVPDAGPERDYAVLYSDEAGVHRWIFPAKRASPGDARSRAAGGGQALFLLPRAPAEVPVGAVENHSRSRGPIITGLRRLVRVLSWAADQVVGPAALALARGWEGSRRPYGLRPLPFDGRAFTWDAIRGGRALLLIHGTFSSAVGSFATLPAATVDRLLQLYQGRVFALDHPSLHVTPQENADWMLRQVPAGLDLEVDLVTHSRGGLVGRELAARAARPEGGPLAPKVRRAILVASPNRGTALADGSYMIDVLDRFTNLLESLPDNAYTLSIEAVLVAAKLTAHAALAALPGLFSMLPAGDYLSRLNAGAAQPTHYYAFAADYRPSAPSLLARLSRLAAGHVIDAVFGEASDGVVPTLGSYDIGVAGSGFSVPPDRHKVFVGPEVHHCNFFSAPALGETLVEWLAAE